MKFGRYVKVKQYRVWDDIETNITNICLVSDEYMYDLEGTEEGQLTAIALKSGEDKGKGFVWVDMAHIMALVENVTKEEYEQFVNESMSVDEPEN